MTREHFELLCFGEPPKPRAPPVFDARGYGSWPVRHVSREEMIAMYPLKLANPADAERFTRTPTRYFDVSDDHSELTEITLANDDDLRYGYASAWEVGTRLGSTTGLLGTIESIDYARGVVTARKTQAPDMARRSGR